MRPRVLVVAASVTLAGLAAGVLPSVEADVPPTLMLRLSSDATMAHACPIGPQRALTNKHVLDRRFMFSNGAATGPLGIFAYDDGLGSEGIARGKVVDEWRDLGDIVPLEGYEFARWYPVAKERPKVGDRVWVIGYDWRDKKRAAAERRWDGKVTRIVALQLWTDTGADFGSSGSCVINARGEAIAVNSGFWQRPNSGDGDRVGIATLIYGPWLEAGRR